MLDTWRARVRWARSAMMRRSPVRQAALVAAESLEVRQLLSVTPAGLAHFNWNNFNPQLLELTRESMQADPRFAQIFNADLMRFGLPPIPQAAGTGALSASATISARVLHATKPFTRKPHLAKPQIHKPTLHKPAVHKPAVHRPTVHRPAAHHPTTHRPALHPVGTLASGGIHLAHFTSIQPTVTASSFIYDTGTLPQQLTFAFNEAVSASSWPSAVTVQNLSTGNALALTNSSFAFNNTSDTLTVNLGSTRIPDGNYAATLAGSQITDSSNNHLAGSDGIAGDPFNYSFFILAGDLNHDGVVDTTDYNTFNSYFNKISTGGIWSQGDLNYDGAVNNADYLLLRKNYGENLSLTIPTGVQVTDATPTTVSIGWTAVNDPNATGYDILRNGSVVATNVTGTAFTDTGLTANTPYAYTVESVNSVGQFSPPSHPPASVTTPAIAVSISGAAAVVQGSSYTLNLNASYVATPNGSPVTQWVVDWGDGTDEETFTGNPASVTHTFLEPLAATAVQAWATDGNGTYAAAPLSLTVAASAPTLSVTGAASVAAGATYTLGLSAAYPLSGPGIQQWSVDCGDGTDALPDVQTFAGTTSSVTHTFAAGVASPVIVVSAQDANDTYFADPLQVTVTGVSVPAVPTGVRAIPYAPHELDVSWMAGSANALGYTIQRSADGGQTWQTIATVDGATTNYSDGGVAPGTSYLYEVVATNDAGASSASAPSSPVQPPADAVAISAAPGAGGSIVVTWSYAGQDQTGFELEMSEANVDNYHLVSTPAANGSQTFSGLDPGQSYDFRIRVDHGDSTVSDYAVASASTPPDYDPQANSLAIDSLYGGAGADGYLPAADQDGDPLTFSLVGTVQNGSVTIDPMTGHYSFVPVSGDRLGFFVYKATDAEHDSNLASVSIHYYDDSNSSERSFLVANQSLTVPEYQTLSGGAGALMGGAGGDPLSVARVMNDPGDPSASAHQITVNPDGSYTYVPPPNYVGSDWFTVQFTDTVTGAVSGYSTCFINVLAAPRQPPRTPATPSKLNVVLTGPSGVSLNWHNDANNEDGFMVERANDAGFTTGVTTVFTGGPDATTCADTLPNTTQIFYYRVSAFNKAGNSGYAKASQSGLVLRSVSFGGKGFEQLLQDTGAAFGQAYDSRQWFAGNLAAGVTTPTQDYPVAYVRSGTRAGDSKPRVTVDFATGAKPPPGAKWMVQGLGTTGVDDSYTFPPAALQPDQQGGMSASITSQQRLPTAIADPNLTIYWQVSFDGGNTWSAAGSSTNHVYVAGAKALTTAQRYETVLALGCIDAAGLTPGQNDAGILSGIYGTFETLNVRHIANDQSVGNAMSYWGAFAGPQAPQLNPDFFTTLGLLKHSDGRCNAWSLFFQDVTADQGEKTSFVSITPNYVGPVPVVPQQRPVPRRQWLVINPGPAQGNPNPTNLFANHAVVVWKAPPQQGQPQSWELFDPSYGTAPISASGADYRIIVGGPWEQASLSKIRIFYTGGATNDVAPLPLAPKNPLNCAYYPQSL